MTNSIEIGQLMIRPFRSLKCKFCKECWPSNDLYDVCPTCREETEGQHYTLPTLTEEEAAKRKKHDDFGWWLWDTGRMDTALPGEEEVKDEA